MPCRFRLAPIVTGTIDAVADIRMQRRHDLCLRELFAAKIAIHKLFTRLCHCLKQILAVAAPDTPWSNPESHTLLFHSYSRDRLAAIFTDIDITDKLLILTDRQMEQRCNLLAIQLSQLLHHLTEAGIDRQSILDT